MSADEKQTPIPRPWPWWRCVLTGLSALALALSSYLGWHYVVGGSVLGCSGGSSCDQVLGSKWSAIGGVVPVSGLAAGAYLAMLLASFYLGPTTEAPIRRLAWRTILVLVGAAAGSAVWFIIVQERFIGAFCPYCMATHLTGLVLAALVLWQAPRQFDNDSADVPPFTTRRVIRPLPAFGVALFGVAVAGLMAVCQVVFAPSAVYRGGESPAYKLPAFDPHAVPLVGSPEAPSVVVLLFDYECPHCQKLHALLDEVVQRSGGKIAFALCPAPLNTQCNPYIPRDVDEFKDSCALTKTALAVWVANRAAFPAFDRWLYSAEPGQLWHPRGLAAARAQAIELVGEARFTAAQADPWISQYLQTSVQIFGDTGANAVPKLVFGSHWVNPEPTDANDLISILHSSLAVPPP